MASNFENRSSNEKYLREKSISDDLDNPSHKYDSEKSRSSSSHSRKKTSLGRTHRDSSRERHDYSRNSDERFIHFTEDRRISYRSEDREHYQHRHEISHNLSTSFDGHDSERNHRDFKTEHHDDRSTYRRHRDDKSPERNVRTERRDHHDKSYDDSRDHSRSSHHSERLRDEDHMLRDHKPNDERHISYRDSTKPGDEEFIASLLQKIDFLGNQVDYLTQENERLRFKNADRDDSMAEVSVKFSNKKFEEKFAPILKELATDLITGRCTIEALTLFLESSDLSQKHSESWNPEGELFSLDISCEEPKESSSSVPRYDSSFNEVLQTPDATSDQVDKDKKNSRKKAKLCFNCDGDHFIQNCPIPKNYKRIAFAKKQMRNSRPIPLSSKRYHLCDNEESEFKPGTISDELREALSLQKNQIPPYIYRMRILDYPPGWLQEATVENSGIALYDSSGPRDDKSTEQNQNELKVEYDPKKLIDYPGFNAPLPPDFIDECSFLGLPPMQTCQLREIVEQAIPRAEPTLSRKRKLVLPEPKNTKNTRLEESMEIDEDDLDHNILEFNPPLPDESLPPPPPPEDSPDSPTEDSPRDELAVKIPLQSKVDTLSISIEPFGDMSPSSGTASPSLTELEEMKKRLVMELGIGTPALDASNEDSAESPKTSSDHLKILENHNDLSNFSDSSFSSKSSSLAEAPSSLKRTDSVSSSKLVSLGTPSISRHSSFSKLPDYENFSKNVTSHLNFENLPNSTGTYQKMKKVIKSVKEKIHLLMQ